MEEFITPPEAPVFQPTLEEFSDPVAYISKIRPVVINTGICRVRPPPGWKPPFAVDVETFCFTPRLQPLNELEAKSRVKLNFLENLAKFWELQGISFKVPNVDRHPLDLHKVFKLVTEYGGFEEVSLTRRWTQLTKELGYDNHTVAGSIRANYEKYLYPYEVFLVKNGKLEVLQPIPAGYDIPLKRSPRKVTTPVKESPAKCKYGLRQNRRRNSNWEDPDYVVDMDENNPEFKKLAFTCPGPKNSFAPLQRSSFKRSSRIAIQREEDNVFTFQDEGDSVKQEPSQAATPPFGPPPLIRVDPGVSPPFQTPQKTPSSSSDSCSQDAYLEKLCRIEQYKCVSCGSGECDEELLLCDSCDLSYHMFCLDPPLHSVPPGDWRCPTCIAKECSKPQEAFGFDTSKKQYTLRTFGQMANNFKQQYFNMPIQDISTSVVEREFWRLVSSIEDDVVVEYGADLHSSKHGSGFPMTDKVRSPEEDDYAKSSWNLNNIPNIKGSALRYIEADISGMKVPWVYVGMCFSCFCWHIEDHWSYSINYLHWGEPKTWYGVPSAYAESLEATMKDQAPELFENQPDLMHHLSTTLSPTILMKNGIPVVRTDQCAGEFVITFPRAYHAGFNQGFNFAEAVNFSLADWLPMGRGCIEHYRQLNHAPVFSHDELLCKMIAQPERLELCLLVMASEDAQAMVRSEERTRRAILQKGVTFQQRELFELVEDCHRQCCVCNTCCFHSAVRCPCNEGRLSCLQHAESMCHCPLSKKVLRYRYTIEELHGMLDAIQDRAGSFRDWSVRVEGVLDGVLPQKADIQHLRELSNEADTKSFVTCCVYDELKESIHEVEKCAHTAMQIVLGKHKTRSSNDQAMDVNGLREFLKQVECLPCSVPEAKLLQERLESVEQFQEEASSELLRVTQAAETLKSYPLSHLEMLIKTGEELEIAIPEVDILRTALQQMRWVTETEAKLKLEVMTIDSLRNFMKQGSTLTQNRVIEVVMNKIKVMLNAAQEWEQKVKTALKQKPPQPETYYETMLSRTKDIPVKLPSVQTITDALEKARDWNKRSQALQESDKHPHYDTLKMMLATGRPIPVKLDLLAQLESRYAAAKAWVDRAARTFLKKNTNNTLLEVLLPRTKANFVHRHMTRVNKKKQEGELAVNSNPLSEIAGDRLKEMDKVHQMESDELKFAKQLRSENLLKADRDERLKSGVIAGCPVVYCFCRKPESGYMLQCELCNEWYHATCLHIPKGKRTPGKDLGKEARFLCVTCMRTRRPRLDAIVSLLISLQKVPVAISEGTALHCLAEKAIAWQRRARQAMTSGTSLLEAAKQQRKRIGELKTNIRKWRAEADSNRLLSTTIEAQLASSAGSVLHHYETELQRLRSEYAGLSGTKREEFETLLMEGDLLEVTLDEVHQLWQQLQLDAEYILVFEKSTGDDEPEKMEEVEEQPEPPKEEKEDRKRKRKRTDQSPTPTPTTTPPKPSVAAKEPPKKKKKVKSATPPPSLHKTIAAAPPSAVRREGSGSSNDGLGCNETLEEEEDENECSAPQCRQPVGDQISWVQCDRCEEWFHLMCVGLTKEYAEQMETYICGSCKQPSTTTSCGVQTAVKLSHPLQQLAHAQT